MKHQAPRILALMLSGLLAAAAPARAGTIHFADVMQAAAAGRRGPWADLRLRALQQQGGKTASGLVATTEQKQDAGASTGNAAGASDGSTTGNNPTSLISQDPAQQPQGTVQTIDLGDISGTVCDCGEAPLEDVILKGGGFPWLSLVGIPLICLTGICTGGEEVCVDCGTTSPTPNPTPPPPPPGIPEPATLLLFGSGLLALGAGSRRRRALKALEVEARDQEVV
ncbi:MAG TPA: PEP-CTERM sorting domain-containing protein [Pyrinomonadaceae bacterium]